MRNLGRMIASEFRKLPCTALLALHIWVPVVGVCIFIFYYKISIYHVEGKLSAYFQALACSWPFLCGLIGGMSAEMEEEGGFQNFLLLPSRKLYGILAKWAAVSLLGLGAAGIAVGGFAAGFTALGQNFKNAGFYVTAYLLLWAGQLVVYFIHVWLGLRFGKSVSIGAGLAGALAAGLFLTGLGDGRWMFVPWTWSSRWINYMLLYTSKDMSLAGLKTEFFICGMAALLIFAVILWRAALFEGRRVQE